MWIDPDGLQAVPIPMGPGMTGAVGAAGAYNPNNPNDPNGMADFGPKINGDDVAAFLQINEMISPHNMVKHVSLTSNVRHACRMFVRLPSTADRAISRR